MNESAELIMLNISCEGFSLEDEVCRACMYYFQVRGEA